MSAGEQVRCADSIIDRATGNPTQCRFASGHEGDHDDGAMTWQSVDELTCAMCGTRGESVGFAHDCRDAEKAENAQLRAEVEKLTKERDEAKVVAAIADAVLRAVRVSEEAEGRDLDSLLRAASGVPTKDERIANAEAEAEKLRAELAESKRMFELHRISVAASARSTLAEHEEEAWRSGHAAAVRAIRENGAEAGTWNRSTGGDLVRNELIAWLNLPSQRLWSAQKEKP